MMIAILGKHGLNISNQYSGGGGGLIQMFGVNSVICCTKRKELVILERKQMSVSSKIDLDFRFFNFFNVICYFGHNVSLFLSLTILFKKKSFPLKQ